MQAGQGRAGQGMGQGMPVRPLSVVQISHTLRQAYLALCDIRHRPVAGLLCERPHLCACAHETWSGSFVFRSVERTTLESSSVLRRHCAFERATDT